jgi:hypothetical protein
VLLDVDDFALGHANLMRWNPQDKWIKLAQIVHIPLVDEDTFNRAQEIHGSIHNDTADHEHRGGRTGLNRLGTRSPRLNPTRTFQLGR